MMIPMTREELENASREEIIEAYKTKEGMTRRQAEAFAAILLGEVQGAFDWPPAPTSPHAWATQAVGASRLPPLSPRSDACVADPR
ncbi:hypothetical protein [uncultured Tessaracoccus sp.]|uniref:hypothetical protein n=1 Tax=uncultured Tessaracoccus sp. TaxID=905023 RepID=UPI0025EA0EE9|nr:hypothetical protein [uncultured Tessaracoccus sp.]